jgi:hypothetical protein
MKTYNWRDQFPTLGLGDLPWSSLIFLFETFISEFLFPGISDISLGGKYEYFLEILFS